MSPESPAHREPGIQMTGALRTTIERNRYDFIFMFYSHVVYICKTERNKESESVFYILTAVKTVIGVLT